ncbi:MAG: hypothetical protein QXX83_07100 [Thermofilum sp.]
MSMLEVYLGSETLRRIRAKVEGAVSPYNSPPPPQGVLVLGCDGSLARMLRTDADGRPQVVVVSLPNPPNLDVALSTRASESTLSSILGRLDVALSTRASESTLAAVRDRLPSSLTTAGNLRTAIMEDAVGLARDSTLAAVRDRLPSSLTSAGNLRTAIVEDAVGLARDSTVSSILNRLDVNLSTRASESTLAAVRDRLPSSLTTAGNFRAAVVEDAVGLARDSTVAAVRDRLPSSLTTAGNFRVAVAEDAVGLARDSTLAAVRDRLPSSLTTAGNLKVAILEDAVGVAKESTLSSILGRLDVALSTRASESTLGGIKSQTDKLTFDASNRLYVNAAVVANPPNLDRSLLTVKRELLSFAPVSGSGAALPADDYTHWTDTTEYAVTETSWTRKTYLRIRPRNMRGRAYHVHFYVQGYVAAGQTLYVRLRSDWRGVILSLTFTETSYTTKEAGGSYLAPAWWEDILHIEAYVTGGTGYIRNVSVSLIPENVVEGWDYTIGEGERFRPIRVDSSGYVYVYTPSLTSPADAETYTTTPLAANAAYYGPTRDFSASRLAAMGVMGYADQPSATDGVYIQLSIDGSNWDYRGATTTLPAAGAVSLCQVVTARYARAVWVNGPVEQTAFRFGGRYMIAGSENPPFSPVVDYPEVAVCSVCGADRTETGDFFAERDPGTGTWVVFCPKCYANKRWREVEEKGVWIRSLRAWWRSGADKARVKMHTPDEVEGEVV